MRLALFGPMLLSRQSECKITKETSYLQAISGGRHNTRAAGGSAAPHLVARPGGVCNRGDVGGRKEVPVLPVLSIDRKD